MKSITFSFLLLTTAVAAQAQTIRIDSVAILILDRMSGVIGDLNACSFSLQTSTDVPDNSFFAPHEGIGLVKHFDKHEVYIDGPDKMLVNSNGDKGHRGYWYDGKQIAYYSYTEHNFGYVPAPGNLVETIHEVNRRYGIEFPAGDFFFPSFVDDLIQNNQQIIFLGTTRVMGKRCFHIVAAGEEKSTQFWISDDGLTLPVKMVIVYLDQEDRPQYEATFSDWRLNPDLPATLFEFLPPPNARELTIVPRPEN